MLEKRELAARRQQRLLHEFDDILRAGHKLHQRIVESSTEIYDFVDIAEAKMG